MSLDLLLEVFEQSPYENFDSVDLKPDLQGWNSEKQVFADLIEELKPSLIIEIGCWKGASTVWMAEHLKKHNASGKIFCIDTWLGSIEHWEKKNSKKYYDYYASLRLKNGYPQLYYQFLFNMIQAGLQDMVIPFPNTSQVAWKWLEFRKIKAEMIYVDGSHEEEEVFQDLVRYSTLVKPGGVILGDDYEWQGVRRAVERFSDYSGIEPSVHEEGTVWKFKMGSS